MRLSARETTVETAVSSDVPPARAPGAQPRPIDARLQEHGLVDQAVGMLMTANLLSARSATATLRRWARRAGLPLVDMAAGVVEAGARPDPHPFEVLCRLLRDDVPPAEVVHAEHDTP